MGLETITHVTEIAAAPEVVRSIFLEYEKYAEWNDVWSWTPLDTKTKNGFELQPGDRAAVKSKGIGSPTTLIMTSNAEDVVGWKYEAKVPVMKVSHDFYFKKSDRIPGGTTFTNHEIVTGLLSFVMNPGRSYGKINADNFAEFGQDLKKRCESGTVTAA